MRGNGSPELMSNQRYALVSVFDKTGIADLARTFDAVGIRIISSSGTARALMQENIPVTPVEEITQFPECLGGRIKTINPKIEGGILYRRDNLSDVKEALVNGIPQIDIVVCNLYPFEKTIEKKDVTFAEAIENIDVGGPTMIRAAAKNHKDVLVVVDPNDYKELTEKLLTNKITPDFRQKLAEKAFWHLSFYDSQIANYLKGKGEEFPGIFTIPGRRKETLRYGDNSHQNAASYEIPSVKSLVSNLEKVAGRELSLTNLTDINAGYEAVRLFNEPTAVIIKHNSPCGIALGKDIAQALERAIQSDPESAFGGVVVLNKPMDLSAAEVIASFKDEEKSMMDIIAVPRISSKALEVIKIVRKTTGVYTFGRATKPQASDVYIKGVSGGFTMQTADAEIEKSFKSWKVVTRLKSNQRQLEQMEIAWKFISRIRSNAIIIVDKNLPMTRGIGSGQTSRFRSTKIALEQAGKYAKGAVLASDSFFPFDDSVKLAAKYGIEAIVQQGGSINDQASIDAANKAGIAMVFTGRRAFWH